MKKFVSKILICDLEYQSPIIDDMTKNILKKLGKDIPEPGQIVEIPLLIPSPENAFISTKIVVEGKEFKHVEQNISSQN